MANGRSVQPCHELQAKNSRKGKRLSEDSNQVDNRRPVARPVLLCQTAARIGSQYLPVTESIFVG